MKLRPFIYLLAAIVVAIAVVTFMRNSETNSPSGVAGAPTPPQAEVEGDEDVQAPIFTVTGTIASIEGDRITIENIESDDFSDDTLVAYPENASEFSVGDKVEVSFSATSMSIPAQALMPTMTKVN